MLPAESASSAATYWDRLLRHHWQALEKEEGAPNRVGDLLLLSCSPAEGTSDALTGHLCVSTHALICGVGRK